MSLAEHVDVVVGRHPERDGLTDNIRVVEHHVAELESRTAADHTVEHAFVAAALDFRKHAPQRLFHQAGVIRRCEGIPCQNLGVEENVELQVGLLKGRITLGENTDEQNREKHQAGDDGRNTVEAKALFGPVAAGEPGVDDIDGFAGGGPLRRCDMEVTHTAPGIYARPEARSHSESEWR